MNKLKFLLPILVGILVATGCDSVDFGDINEDDDAVTEVNTEGLMSGAMNRFFTVAGRDYHTKPMLYVQYQSQNVYTDEQRYNEAPADWTAYYRDVLNNLNTIVELTSGDEVDELTQTYGAPKNQQAVAELFSALVWKRVTDTWGPVPYSEALDAEVLNPAYDSQQAIYTDLIARVKAARDMLDPSLPGPTGDAVYGGEVGKWQKFANSFLLSLTLQISETGEASMAATEFNAALDHSAGVIENVEDEFWYDHANAPGAENPFNLLRPADYNMSEPFVDALKGNADGSTITYSNSTYDDRLNIFADDPSIDGRPFGWSEYPDGAGPFSNLNPETIWAPGSDLPYMTAAYTYLNRAEAAERGWTNEVAADLLEDGILASYETLDAHYDDGDSTAGLLQSDGSNYAANRLTDAANVGMAQVIGEEKWVALFPMGFDAWSEWRRTDTPGLIPSPEPYNNGDIPTRYPYPSTESGVNDSYGSGVDKLSPAQDSNTSKFWWDE